MTHPEQRAVLTGRMVVVLVLAFSSLVFYGGLIATAFAPRAVWLSLMLVGMFVGLATSIVAAVCSMAEGS